MTEHPTEEIAALIAEVDEFIAAEIRPLEERDDNARFLDHRREYSRTDFEAGGIPSREWEALLRRGDGRADRGRALALRAAGRAGRSGRHQPRDGGRCAST